MKVLQAWFVSLAGVLALLAAPLDMGSTARAADSAAPLPALDDYITKPDASYQWHLVQTVKTPGCTVYLVDMTSQTWRTTKEVNRPEWKHWLIVAKPDRLAYHTAFLGVFGGSNGGNAPDPTKSMVVQIARLTRSVTIELKTIPNQPLIFCNDGEEREEDNLIAYTWDKVIRTGDPTWSARFPMVKSVVRAMDTVQALMASPEGGNVKIDKFVVAGASKRGWTTWLAGAVDKRVAAIIPIVIDTLNFDLSLRHHFAVYGLWAPSVHDYVRHKIVERVGSADAQKRLYDVEDPYCYRHRLTIPKYIVTASGDQFFPPDASRFYFDNLQGEKYLRTIPNADHSMDGSDWVQTVVTFYQMILANKPRPRFTWKFESPGVVRIQCKDQPAKVTLWTASNPDARDFRLESLGRKYQPTVLKGDHGTYLAEVEKPAKGWTAYFVELSYPVGGIVNLKVTTPLRVIPDALPFGDKIIPGTNVKAGQ
jgi:PhoPQ-activated pathogenicity-related protein